MQIQMWMIVASLAVAGLCAMCPMLQSMPMTMMGPQMMPMMSSLSLCAVVVAYVLNTQQQQTIHQK